MKVSNDMAINLAHSEVRSLRAFFSLYVLLTLFILSFLAYFYFQSEKKMMLSHWRMELQLQSESFLPRLKKAHYNFAHNQSYPRSDTFSSGIYDIDKTAIFSTLRTPYVDLNEVISLNEGYIQLVIQPEFYYLGAKYIVLEVPDDGVWFSQTLQTIIIFFTLIFVLLLLSGWYLGKLFLRPMKEAVSLLDRFIKDTTHELNTPVATILSNIETINTQTVDDKTAKKLQRIDIASRTISTLYDDLTYLVLNHNIPTKDEELNLSELLHERIDYFDLAIKQKKLQLETEIAQGVSFLADRTKMTRLIDNLLSNAIKYNALKGELAVTLTSDQLSIANSGKGIAKEKLSTIFNRYVRADNVAGGFGIGLHIVSKIAKLYKIKLEIDSEPHKMTRITLSW